MAENRRSSRLLVIGAALLVAVAIAPVAVGLASGLVLYELLAAPYARLARRIPPRLAAALTAIAVLVVIVVPMVWLGFHIAKRVPAVVAAARAFRDERAAVAGGSGLVAQLNAGAADVANSVSDWLPGLFRSIARSAAWALVNWSVALLALYYLLGDASAAWQRFTRWLPLSPQGAEMLRVRFREITKGMIAGTLLSAAIQGVAIGTGLWLAGLPDAVFWGAAAAITTLVPVIGNAIVSVPALVLVLLRHNYNGAIAIAIFSGPLPPIIDRVVRATVSRHIGSVHPMVTLVGAVVGAAIAGVPGLILGPVALAMFFVLLDVYDKDQVGWQLTSELPRAS